MSGRGAVTPGPAKPTARRTGAMTARRWVGLLLGPALLLATLVLPVPQGLSAEGWRTAGLAGLMATWWITEAVPIPATALLPLILLPLLGLVGVEKTAAPYANPLIYLFLGGFLIALGMQRWGLHRRVALALIRLVGTRPRRIVAGFLLASALLSMWVSNTATALMMLPIAVSVADLVPEEQCDAQTRGFATALLLSVAYGSTCGGLATLIGTPPNALLAAYVSQTYGLDIGFGKWMLLGLPMTMLALPLVYVVLTRVAFRLPAEPIPGVDELMRRQRDEIGRMSFPERAVAVVFVCTALLWVTRPLLERFVPMLNDTSIAILGGMALFLIPVRLREGVFLMDWEHARALPWDVLILFGGGLSLAGAIGAHGLAEYLGSLFDALRPWPMVLTVTLVSFAILMLTELTSNTATAATFLPIVGAVAVSTNQNPLLFLIPAVLASSCAFMLPVGTPPNAVVFGSGRVTLPQMARTGIVLNLLFVPLVVLVALVLGPVVFGPELAALRQSVQP